MPPPEIWGPAIWTLFHTLSEKMNENMYNVIAPQLFNHIIRICKFLPCPECAQDATKFLAKINISDLKNNNQFKNTFYLFHNYVNFKKRKPLFNYANMNKYKNYNIIYVFKNFINVYNTKGNMKLLTESFQRQFVIKDFSNWFKTNIRVFIPYVNISTSPKLIVNQVEEEIDNSKLENIVSDISD
jgi:hypothetical protein